MKILLISMGYIYKITNINKNCKDYNFTYIGQTKQSLERRFKQHIYSAYKSNENNYFHNAIKKYGSSSFEITLIKEVDNDMLNIEEINEINKRKLLNEAQYNTAEGGYNNPKKYMSVEQKQKSIDKFKTTMKNKTDEELNNWKQKISNNVSGTKNGMYGKHHSKETKEKIRNTFTQEKIEKYRENNIGKNNPMYHKCPWNKGQKMSKEYCNKLSEKRKGKNAPNYNKKLGDSSNHKNVILVYPNGATIKFTSKKECSLFLGYSADGLKMNKIIKSKDSNRNGCIVVYDK